MIINSQFDSGNIIVKSADNPNDIRLEIRPDNQSEFLQWFHFRVSNVAGESLKMTIENAGDAAYVGGWPGYKARASYDRETWFMVDTSFDGQNLTIDHQCEADTVWFAYFAPFSMDRHFDLIAWASQSSIAKNVVLGKTLDGQDLDMIVIDKQDDMSVAPEDKLNCWLIARQHPGESMAEWWMEGALNTLLDESHPVTSELLESCRFYIVPNMNPDGSYRGHLRTNAAGANLNREWAEPTMERSPEVFLVRQKMHEVGVDFHMDVHGDEAIPHNFIAGYEAIHDLDPEHMALYDKFEQQLATSTPEFQAEAGYPKSVPNSSDMKKCTDYTAGTFKCLAMTLEMPFKDHDNNPDPVLGWSPVRCGGLAQDCLATLLTMLPDIKAYKAKK